MSLRTPPCDPMGEDHVQIGVEILGVSLRRTDK